MTPGGVAAASLQQALASGDVQADDCILLNISGGGSKRLKEDIKTHLIEPWKTVKKATGVASILTALESES